MEFLAGVLDWHSPNEPTCESIEGARCLDQGRAHISSITLTGGAILGQRDLTSDGIEPWLFRGADFHVNSNVYLGLAPVRPQTAADQELPILGTWGCNVVRVIAEARFVTRP